MRYCVRAVLCNEPLEIVRIEGVTLEYGRLSVEGSLNSFYTTLLMYDYVLSMRIEWGFV